MRLVGGSNPNEGRVEVLYNDVWGTICDDNWDTQDATVVCRQLGLPTANVQALGEAHFGQGLGSTWLDDVNCQGYEVNMAGCFHNGWGVHDCTHSEDASVICRKGKTFCKSCTLSLSHNLIIRKISQKSQYIFNNLTLQILYL